jgi:hypothetical protein
MLQYPEGESSICWRFPVYQMYLQETVRPRRIQLNHFTEVTLPFTPLPMSRPATARRPQTFTDQPLTQRLDAHPLLIFLRQIFARQRRTEVGVLRAIQFQDANLLHRIHATIRSPSPQTMHHTAVTLDSISPIRTLRPPVTQPQ